MIQMDPEWYRAWKRIEALGGLPTIRYRPDKGDYSVEGVRAEIKEGDLLRSVGGVGMTPDDAVARCWQSITDGSPVVVLNAYGPDRQEYRWDSVAVMWRPVGGAAREEGR